MTKTIIQNKKEMIGRRVGQLMREKGLTPEWVAEQIGRTVSDVSQLVNGQALWLDDDDLRRLIIALDLVPEGRSPKGKSIPDYLNTLTHEALVEYFLPQPPDEPPSPQFKMGL